LDNESYKELEISEPILDIVMGKPGELDSRFNIRVFKKDAKLSASEMNDGILHGDLPYLHAHGVKTKYRKSGAKYIKDVYLKQRQKLKLDEIEGPLSSRIMSILQCESREKARELFPPIYTPKKYSSPKKL
jgi:hypothetical protein